MDQIYLEPSQTLPEVKLNNGKAFIEGNIIPEDARKFFAPIFEWAENYPENKLEFESTLFYINTSSTVCLHKVFDTLNKKNVQTKLKWCYEEDDEDMKEMGEFIAEKYKCVTLELIEIAPL